MFHTKNSFLLLSLLFISLVLLFFFSPKNHSLVSITSNAVKEIQDTKVDGVLEKEIRKEGQAKVIVTLKENAETQDILEQVNDDEVNNTKQFITTNSFSAQVSEEGLEKLKQDPTIVYINFDYPIEQTLLDTRPLTNATRIQNTLFNGINITGKGLSACIIDTGIYAHAAFGTRILKEACYCSVSQGLNSSCCPDGTSIQTTGVIGDNNGHGTHISGIVASNDSTYKGIAPEAGIVMVKVLNSSGSGATSDLISALDFCINNSTLYNITVISMSLGCSGGFTGFCDESSTCDSNSIAPFINAAIAKNITVVAATGNSGSTSQILSPACIENVTAVGSSTKTDGVSSFSNRNGVTDLFAPGSSITSTYNDGGFAIGSGTSQAAPHVAGVILLYQAYKRQESKISIPSGVQNILNKTGFMIYDAATFITFSRINIYSAIAQADSQAPSLTLFQPTAGIYLLNMSLELNYSVLDPFLEQTFYSLDGAVNVTLTGNTTFNVSVGTHTLLVYANDTAGNLNLTSVTFSSSSYPTLTILSPVNGKSYASGSVLINVTNSSNTQSVLFFNETANETYTISVSRTFSEGTHTLTFFANTSEGKQNQTSVSFSVDLTMPQVNILSPSVSKYNNATLLINISSDGNIFFFNGTANETYTAPVYRTFSEGTNTLLVYANDTAGNLNSSSVTFTIDTGAPIITFVSPIRGQELNADFIINASIIDVQSGVNATQIFYRWENGTRSSWMQMTNVSKIYWHALFNSSSISEGTYTLTINATDNSGSQSTVSLSSIEKDITPPVQTSVSGSAGSSSASISWTTNVLSNSSVVYGTSKNLGSIQTASTKVTSHTLSLSSLSTQRMYFYNVSSCDNAGNCKVDGIFNFTTSSSSGGGGSSSPVVGGVAGGGGGAASVGSQSNDQNKKEVVVEPKGGEPAAIFAPELEETLTNLFDNNFTKGFTELKEYEYEKKLVVKNSESLVKLKVRYKGGKKLKNLLIYFEVPKSFAKKSSDITVNTENEETLKLVKEDPSYFILYGSTSPNQTETIEVSTGKTFDPSILDDFENPKIYTSKNEAPELSAFKSTTLTLQRKFSSVLAYWWIFVIFLLGIGSALFFYADEIKYYFGIGYPKRTKPLHE